MDGSDGRPDGDPLDGIVPSDYEMDPNVVSGTLANYGIPDALAGLPTLTIVMAPSAFLGASGIYGNSSRNPFRMQKLDVGAGPQLFLTITSRIALGADEVAVAVTAEFATVLPQWNQPAIPLGENIALDATVTRRWRAPVPLGGSQFLRIKATLTP